MTVQATHQTTKKPQGRPRGEATTELTPYRLLVNFDYSVVPSGGGDTGKSPLVHWQEYQQKPATLEDLGAWEQEFSPSLWGVVTGSLSRVVVIDVDRPELRTIFDEAGLSPHIQTPRGGFHYWFRHPGGKVKTVAGLLPGIDVRGDGGFINVIGKRKDGEYKTLIAPSPDAIYPWEKLPDRIAKALTQQKPQSPPVKGGIIPDHKRNATLTRIAGTLQAKGLSQEAIEAALQGINATSCKPPLEADEVTSIAQSVARYQPSEDLETGEGMPVTNTDTGNAVRLVRLFGERLRYCYEQKCWYVWTRKVWQKDLGSQINHYATQTVKHIYVEASKETDTAKAKELAKHAMQSESNHRIVAMIARAESQPGIPIGIQEIDQDNWLLNCANGTIDLRTGELLPFNKQHYITHIIATPYDANATCPIFDKFLEKVTRGDTELMAYIQKCVGYSLTGDTRTELVFFVYGEGQNGKSTFISTIRVLLGCYAHRVSPDIFMQLKGKGSGGPKESLANLRGKRFVAASEIEEGRRLHMALVKSLTGAETITADRKYEHEIEWQPTHHLWLSGNYRPEIRDDSIAAWRRLKIVPFTVYIPDEEKDEALKFKLLDELPGILAWAVRGCLAYQKDGLADPQAVTQATSDYRKENDILGIFMDECCVLEDGASITNKGLRLELKAWCIGSGLDSLNTHQIKRLMLARGFEPGTSSDGKHRVWRGIRLRELTDTIPDDSQEYDKTMEGTDKSDDTDKSFVKTPKTPLIKAKHKKFMENTQTSVKLSKDDVVMSRPAQPDYPDYPIEPCSCGSDLFWPGPTGWLCCTCRPRPPEDN